ncbi:hypothetical protein K8Q93_03050 [Candidatus Parcubacteria bacterium]|nr:hypothetical protein [Candidatus Parcubacteria bacterium]
MSSGTSTPITVQGSTQAVSNKTQVAAVATVLETKKENAQRSLEAVVREYFSDTPMLAEVARCETRFRHYDRKGEVLRGEIDNNDVGIMQVNERYHLKRAEKHGFDIYSLEGNLAYAKYLYLEEGSDPWASSSRCWGGYRENATKSVAIKSSAFAKISVPLVDQNN